MEVPLWYCDLHAHMSDHRKQFKNPNMLLYSFLDQNPKERWHPIIPLVICEIVPLLFIIGPVGRVFIIDPGDLGSIPGCIIPKTLKMVFDNSLLNTQQYKVHIEDKVEQSRERSSALPYTSV